MFKKVYTEDYQNYWDAELIPVVSALREMKEKSSWKPKVEDSSDDGEEEMA